MKYSETYTSQQMEMILEGHLSRYKAQRNRTVFQMGILFLVFASVFISLSRAFEIGGATSWAIVAVHYYFVFLSAMWLSSCSTYSVNGSANNDELLGLGVTLSLIAISTLNILNWVFTVVKWS